MKKALVCGAGGFIEHHMVRRLKSEEFWARGINLKYPEFWEVETDDFIKKVIYHFQGISCERLEAILSYV